MADAATTHGSGRTGGADAARRAPRVAGAFRAQAALIFRRGWSLAGLAAVVFAPMGLIAGVTAGAETAPTLASLLGNFWSFPLLAGLFAPLAIVWRGEGPSGRAYHWTLPVDRPVQQLLRIAAGWLHLMAGVAAGLLVAWGLGALFHGGMALGRPGVVLGLFPSITVLYLLGSVAAVATDHPLVWIFVAYLAVGAIQAVASTQGWGWLDTAVAEAFTTGPLSLSAAAAGPQGLAFGEASDLVRWRPWQAVPLWIAISAALTAAAARVHLERAGEG